VALKHSNLRLTALALILVSFGALAVADAWASSRRSASVSLQFVSPSAFAGRVSSRKASCVSGRVVRLQRKQGKKWVTLDKVTSNRSGRFKGTLSASAGDYRAYLSATASCGIATSSIVKAGGQGGQPGGSLATCNLPLTHDAYDGFHIAVPNGWDLATLRGELEVESDAAAEEAVLISPAAQTTGLTLSSYFQSQLSSLESQAGAQGRTITITGRSSQGGIPSVTFTAPINGQTVDGYATVVMRQFGGQLSTSEVDFVAYWAPAAAFAAQTATLKAVAACYGPERATLYRVFQDQVFTYLMPPGWRVGNETQDALDLVDGHGDYVTYELVGGNEFDSPQSLINVFLSGDGIQPVALWTVNTPAQQLQTGGTESGEYEEFSATWNGQAVHGLMFASTDVGFGFNTGTVRIVISSAAAWNAVNGALIQMVGAIQHNFTQDLQEIARLNQQWQNFSGQVEDFDDVINNQQLTQDPTTGIYYEAPYNSYEVDGPNGPGYYLNDQQLNIIRRQ
jgi:hypothetical protein